MLSANVKATGEVFILRLCGSLDIWSDVIDCFPFL